MKLKRKDKGVKKKDTPDHSVFSSQAKLIVERRTVAHPLDPSVYATVSPDPDSAVGVDKGQKDAFLEGF